MWLCSAGVLRRIPQTLVVHIGAAIGSCPPLGRYPWREACLLYRDVKDTVVTVDDPQPATVNSYTFVLVHGGCHDGSLWQPSSIA